MKPLSFLHNYIYMSLTVSILAACSYIYNKTLQIIYKVLISAVNMLMTCAAMIRLKILGINQWSWVCRIKLVASYRAFTRYLSHPNIRKQEEKGLR